MLLSSEIEEAAEYIEKSIFSGRYIKEYAIYSLQKSIQNRIEDSRSFYEYKSLKNVLEKLNWLKFKNMILRFNDIEEDMIKDILKISPGLEENLIKLMDLQNEREERVIEYIKENK